MQRTWILPLVVSLAMGCGNRSNNNNNNRRPPHAPMPSAPIATPTPPPATPPSFEPGVLPDGAVAPPPAPVAEPAADGDGGAAAGNAPSTLVPSREDGEGGRVYEAEGITVTVRRDGYVHVVTSDRWSNHYDQLYESCSFVKNALPTLQRTLSDENSAMLQGICGEAADLSPETLRLISQRRPARANAVAARPGPARPAPSRPAP